MLRHNMSYNRDSGNDTRMGQVPSTSFQRDEERGHLFLQASPGWQDRETWPALSGEGGGGAERVENVCAAPGELMDHITRGEEPVAFSPVFG